VSAELRRAIILSLYQAGRIDDVSRYVFSTEFSVEKAEEIHLFLILLINSNHFSQAIHVIEVFFVSEVRGMQGLDEMVAQVFRFFLERLVQEGKVRTSHADNEHLQRAVLQQSAGHPRRSHPRR